MIVGRLLSCLCKMILRLDNVYSSVTSRDVILALNTIDVTLHLVTTPGLYSAPPSPVCVHFF